MISSNYSITISREEIKSEHEFSHINLHIMVYDSSYSLVIDLLLEAVHSDILKLLKSDRRYGTFGVIEVFYMKVKKESWKITNSEHYVAV